MEELDGEVLTSAQYELDFHVDDEMIAGVDEESHDFQPKPDYDQSPPARSQLAPQTEDADSRPSSKEAASAREHTKISWHQWNSSNAGKTTEGQDDKRDSSRHRESTRRDESSRHDEPSRHRESSRRGSPSRRSESDRQKSKASGGDRPSGQQEPADRGRSAARPQSPKHRATSRHRERSAERSRSHRAARLPDSRSREVVVPKFSEADRRSRAGRLAYSPARRSRSPLRRTITQRPRSPPPARHVTYESDRHPMQPAPPPRMPSHQHNQPFFEHWPELSKSQAKAIEMPLIRPSQGRAPLHATAPQAAWEDTQCDRHPYDSHPMSMDHRYRQQEYHEPAPRHGGYNVPVYRESEYADPGYGAAPGRAAAYPEPSYAHDQEHYREYAGRPAELERDPYAYEQGWGAPGQQEPLRHYPYKDGLQQPDARYFDARHDRADMHPAARPDRDGLYPSASFSRQGLYHDDRPSRPDMREANHQAPRHAPRPATPAPRGYRDLQEDARMPREHRAAAPRFAHEYPTRPREPISQHREPQGPFRPPPPPPAARRASPHNRSPGRRESAADDMHRQRPSQQPAPRHPERATDRSRSHSDRHYDAQRPDRREDGQRSGRHADGGRSTADDELRKTSRSFAMEAKAKEQRHAELPGPPVQPRLEAKVQDLRSEAAKASTLPNADAHPDFKAEPGTGDSSPMLNVEQGFLTAPAKRERPFQRGQSSQQPAATTHDPHKADNGRKDSSRLASDRPSSTRDRASAPKESAAKRSSDAGACHRDAADKQDNGSKQQPSSSREQPSEGRASVSDKGKAIAGDKSRSGVSDKGKADASDKGKAAASDKGKAGASRDAGRPSSRAEAKPAERRSSSRRDVVVEKQAGVKRRSRSPEQARSPKRKAPATNVSGRGNEAEAKGPAQQAVAELPLPPARPSSAALNGLPMPPPRPSSAQQQNGLPSDSKVAAAVLPNGELPMPPKLPLPPPKPQLAPKAETSGAAADANGSAPDKPSSSEAQTRKADNNAVSKAEAKSGKQSEVSKANGKADGHSKSAATADARAARASDKASDRPSADKGLDRPSADKGSDRPSGGRTGQKRSRSRSPLPERRSKAAREHSSDARHAKAADTKRPATRQSSVRNGKVADPETSKRKEWVYQDKTHVYGPVTLQRLRDTLADLKARKDRSKVEAFLLYTVWREADKKKKQKMEDILFT